MVAATLAMVAFLLAGLAIAAALGLALQRHRLSVQRIVAAAAVQFHGKSRLSAEPLLAAFVALAPAALVARLQAGAAVQAALAVSRHFRRAAVAGPTPAG